MFSRNEITATRPTRRHYPWDEMEEYQPDGGMWQSPPVGSIQGFIDATADLMRQPHAFLLAMLRAVEEWPRSTGVALTTPGLNQRAWIGHAGCYLATGSPEETTRLGWHVLNATEQEAANTAADEAIAAWHAANAPAEQMGLFDA